MFPIIPVNPDDAEELEPLGTKRKFCFNDQQGRRMLFKAEERGTGEDWTEKIVCDLARLLHLPHVHYDLAEDAHSQMTGVVCESITSASLSLVLGNQLLCGNCVEIAIQASSS